MLFDAADDVEESRLFLVSEVCFSLVDCWSLTNVSGLAFYTLRILECKDGGYVPFQLASAKFSTYSLPLSSSALGSQSQ